MKKIFTLFATVLINVSLFAQTPEKFSYQAVIRKDNHQLVPNQQVKMRISILQGSATGNVVYLETQTPTTNANGLVSIEIGTGVTSDNFSTIGWSNGPYFLKTETDINNDGTYDVEGTLQLLSVPYALYAKTAKTVLDTVPETDPIFSASVAKEITAEDTTQWSQHLMYDHDTSATNELQNLSINHDTISLSQDGYVRLPNTVSAINVNNDSLLITYSYGQVANAGYVGKGVTAEDTAMWNQHLRYDHDTSATNELQNLSISNDTVSLSNDGSVRLPNSVSAVNVKKDSLYVTYSYGQIANAGYVGNGSPGSSLATVTTTSVNNTSYYETTVNANITNNGNEFILTRGICLSSNSSPDLNDTVYVSGSGSGDFSTQCNNLLPNKKYYVKAFATNSVGTKYGNELSFTTKSLTVPAILTQSASNITNTSAIGGGNITDYGGTDILGRGLCWSLNVNPTLSDSHVSEGAAAGSYIAQMSGLTSNTLYHFRAYATNAQGTSYGADSTFTTIVYQLASLTTNTASNVSYSTATSGGNVTNDNGSPVTNRGLCWGTSTNPTTADSTYTEAGGLGTFTANMTNLVANTTYYVRAFAENGGGTSYGNEVTFTTLAPTIPTLTTKSISGISSNLAGSGGVITLDGGQTITAKGVCWSLNPSPSLLNNFTTDGTGSDSYNSTMTGLDTVTTYYVRAYATNSLGTGYGNELSFTTTSLINQGPTVPVVGTSAASMVTGTKATCGGYVSDDGGSTVTTRGLCWSVNQNPTLSDSYSTGGGTGVGYFTDTISGVSGCGTVYYVRAYATNSTGTGYGNQTTVSTGLLATVATDSVTSIGYDTAVCNSNIPDNGGCDITARGVCWNYNPNPTIGNSHTSDGTGIGTFTSNITGLLSNRTYYVRAYATNNVGTAYGEQKVFTTATPASPYIGESYAGGIVFYIDNTGQHGLVCATTDQSSNATWGCTGTDISTGTAVGTGASNTAAIVASCSESNTAAAICNDLVLNGYSDWFLPSKDELELIYTNLHQQGLGQFYQYGTYWCSSQNGPNYAWTLNIYNNYYNYNSKSSWFYVRAIRAF